MTDPEGKLTEADLVERLHTRYSAAPMNARRYVTADHVPTTPLFGAAIADFLALDCWAEYAYNKDRNVSYSYPDGPDLKSATHRRTVRRSSWVPVDTGDGEQDA